jgi:predicted nucleotidyltransferase
MKMIFGILRAKIQIMIRGVLARQPEIVSAHGFGSFFRDEEFSDIDIIFVLRDETEKSLDIVKSLRQEMRLSSNKLGYVIHPLFMSEREFASKPLKNFNEVKCIF